MAQAGIKPVNATASSEPARLHAGIDAAARLAVTDIHPDEKATSASACLRASVAYSHRLGIKVSRVITDNGSRYTARTCAAACKALNIKHIRTKPTTPKTNGKAERFIQTALRDWACENGPAGMGLREWACARACQTSDPRKHHLPERTQKYNWHRPHSGIGSKPRISRLGLKPDTLLRLHS